MRTFQIKQQLCLREYELLPAPHRHFQLEKGDLSPDTCSSFITLSNGQATQDMFVFLNHLIFISSLSVRHKKAVLVLSSLMQQNIREKQLKEERGRLG